MMAPTARPTVKFGQVGGSVGTGLCLYGPGGIGKDDVVRQVAGSGGSFIDSGLRVCSRLAPAIRGALGFSWRTSCRVQRCD